MLLILISQVIQHLLVEMEIIELYNLQMTERLKKEE